MKGGMVSLVSFEISLRELALRSDYTFFFCFLSYVHTNSAAAAFLDVCKNVCSSRE